MKKSLIYVICGILCLGVAGFFGAKVIWVKNAPEASRTASMGPSAAVSPTMEPSEDTARVSPEFVPETGTEQVSETAEPAAEAAGTEETAEPAPAAETAVPETLVPETPVPETEEAVPEQTPEPEIALQTDGVQTSNLAVSMTQTDPAEEVRSAADTAEAAPAEPAETAVPDPTPEPYVSPVDFEALWEVNPDIYGWLVIPNTSMSLPVVQHPVNDTYYLDHNSDKESSANGAVFSEHEYNSGTWDDPVIVLYGHHMKDGAIFGNLQTTFSSADFLKANPTFTIYTPEEELEYGIFAAVPYSSEHILYYHDFTSKYEFNTFFEEIMNSRSLGALFNEKYAPKYGDHVVILSTCLIGNNTNRFLVMGCLHHDRIDRSEIFRERRSFR